MALSNIFAQMQMQNNDFAAAMKLRDAGCVPPEGAKPKEGQGLATFHADHCPADQAEFSKAALAELDKQQQEIVDSGAKPETKSGAPANKGAKKTPEE